MRIMMNMITAAVKITAPTAPPTIVAIPKLNVMTNKSYAYYNNYAMLIYLYFVIAQQQCLLVVRPVSPTKIF